jgi:hypothetical protein
MDKKSRFFEKYKKLETILNIEIDSSESISIGEKFDRAISKDKRLRQYRTNIFSLTKIRNLFAHNESNPFYEITEDALDTLDAVITLLQSPERAYDIATKKIEYKGIHDLVFEGVKLMKEKRFSFLPIMENSKIIGVFSADVLNSVFSKEKELILDESVTFQRIKNYINLNNHLNERFGFIHREEIKSNIESLFINSYKGNSQDDRPLGCVFVTQSGKTTESILGLITIWDVLD